MSAARRYPFQFWCIVALLSLAVSACGPRLAAQRGPVLADATIETIYVATERALDRTGSSFGAKRNPGLRYFNAAVSVPPVHRPGQIEWHDGQPDPARHFVVTGTQVYDNARSFAQAVKGSPAGSDTVVFVHGYNNTLSEAMYRLVQIQTDFNPGKPSVLYSWPSAGDPRGYVYDRDSVLYARDDLEALLRELTRGPGQKVTLLAHSMGAQLVMEVMRQAAIKGDRAFLARISSVILMSPDIDPDVFRKQAEIIGDLPDPFLIFISQQDRVLSLASLITGSKPRLGVIDGPKAVAGLAVSVIDFTALSEGDSFNHAVPTSAPNAISMLRGMIAQTGVGDSPFQDYLVLKTQP